MKTRIKICVVASVAILAVVLLVFALFVFNTKALSAPLFVNGKLVGHESAEITYNMFKETTALPLLAVLEALGAQVTDVSDGIQQIVLDNTTYKLNVTAKTFTSTNDPDGFDYLAIPPGTNGYICQVKDGDVHINHSSMKYVLNKLGYDSVDITVDRYGKKVIVSAVRT